MRCLDFITFKKSILVLFIPKKIGKNEKFDVGQFLLISQTYFPR